MGTPVTFDGANHYFSGQGVVLIGLKDPVTGEPLGLRAVGNVTDLKISPATTVVEHKGSQDGQRATDSRLQTEVKVQLSFTIDNWTSENLAKATRGSDTVISAGTVTNAAVTGFPGLVSGLRYVKVASVVLKQSSTTLVQFVDGNTPWDYKLNPEAGSIMLNDQSDQPYSAFVPSSPPAASYSLTVSYTYAAQHLVDSLTQPLTDNWLRFEGLNTVEENKPVIVDVFKFSNDPLKELALLSDTYGAFQIEGSLLKDDTRETGSKYFSIKKLE